MTLLKQLISLISLAPISLLISCQQPNQVRTFQAHHNLSLSPFETVQHILNGEETTAADTYVYSIVGVVNLAKGSLCTGTLLNRTHVLTAAHCLGTKVDSLRVFTGFSYRDQTSVSDVLTAVVTPEWESRSNEEFDRGDLAILKITTGLPRNFKPIVFGSAANLQNGDEPLIVGYGRTDGVKKTGHGTLRKSTALIANANFGATEVLFDQTQGKGACHGDSGGPALMNTPNGYVQWGVTSREYQDPDKECTHYSIYTKIDPYLPWIQMNSLD